MVVLAAVVVAVVLLRGDEPREVDAERALDQAVEEPQPDPEDPDDPPDEEPLEPDDDVDEDPFDDPAPDEQLEELTGVWVVDATRPFDRAEGMGSFVGYRVEEELTTIGTNVAVGRSPTVDGQVVIEEATVVEAVVEALLDDLESDDGRRDSQVRDRLGLESTARFELAEPIELPEIPPVGEVVELEIRGLLTIREVRREVVVDLQAAVTPDGLLVTGSTDILLATFDIEAPSAPIVLEVSDEVTLEWQLFLVRSS